MRHTIVYGLIALLSSFFVAQAYADTYVRGYVRKDGIYVAPPVEMAPRRAVGGMRVIAAPLIIVGAAISP